VNSGVENETDSALSILESLIKQNRWKSNVGSSKNLGRATFRKMPEAGLKIAQKGLKNTLFVNILPRHLVWLGSG